MSLVFIPFILWSALLSLGNIFISGITGFIGQHLLKKIHSSLCDEFFIRGMSRQLREPVDYDFIICDILNDDFPADLLDGVDTVFHLAGYAHDLNHSSSNKGLYEKINVEATRNLMDLARKSGVSRFIYVSSVKAGGCSIFDHCHTELDQCIPQDIYGLSKLQAETYVLDQGRDSGMHVSVVRPALVYGPKVKGNLKLMQESIISGWFPPLPHSMNRKSMVHVDDLVGAMLLVASEDRANGEIFIVTDGITYSSRQIYEIMCGFVNKKPIKWSIPVFVFSFLSFISPVLRRKVYKLLGTECYSSEKIESIGFLPRYSLSDINETLD